MPKVPRDVSHDRMVRFLLRNGWRLLREGGRHSVLGNGSIQVAVPRHGILKTGTVAAILRETGPWPQADLARL
jgi:predicted RNA binding protein YcfA (HicA-like mRNA interferase family)